MRKRLVIGASVGALLLSGGLVAVLSQTSESDTENCVSDYEVSQYQDDWSVAHISELFDVPGYVSFVGDDSFRKRYQSCPDGSDYRQVVTYWSDTGLSHGTWQIWVGG